MRVLEDGCRDKENEERYADDNKWIEHECILELKMQQSMDCPLRSASGTPEPSCQRQEGTFGK